MNLINTLNNFEDLGENFLKNSKGIFPEFINFSTVFELGLYYLKTVNTLNNCINTKIFFDDEIWGSRTRFSSINQNETFLNEKKRYNQTRNSAIFTNKTDRNFDLLIVDQRNNNELESNKANNIRAIFIKIRLPNLTVKSLAAFKTTFYLGKINKISRLIYNVREGKVLTRWGDRFYRSKDTLSNSNDGILLTQCVSIPMVSMKFTPK